MSVSATTGQALVKHCRAILEQNLLKAGETLVVATGTQYDLDFVSSLLEAATEIRAVGAHVVVIPQVVNDELVNALTAWHWDLFASADLLITLTKDMHVNPDRIPRPTGPEYASKVGNHPYRTDHEYISRVGSKTKWLDFMMHPYPHLQREYFPTRERKELTLRGAEIMDRAKEIRITSESGTDFTAKKRGRPGMAQYGIADVPGRYDNFGFADVHFGPEEYSSVGTVVLEPGDIVPLALKPYQILTEPIKINFEGGYVTKIGDGAAAKRAAAYLASFNEKETYGTSHIGYGTHEKCTLREGNPQEIAFYHHTAAGSILVGLGANMGLGLGGKGLNYSGLGETTRVAKSHTHFTLLNASLYCDGEKIIDRGKLLLQ